MPSLEGPGDPNCEVQIVLNFGNDLHCIDPTVPLPDLLPGAFASERSPSKGGKVEVAASNESLPVKDREMNPIPSVVRDNQHTQPGPWTTFPLLISELLRRPSGPEAETT